MLQTNRKQPRPLSDLMLKLRSKKADEDSPKVDEEWQAIINRIKQSRSQHHEEPAVNNYSEDAFFNQSEMGTKIIDVTPEVANYWLTTKAKNRNISGPTVNKYAWDMANGKWELNHQGIAFDSNGQLIDGQHRLNAIIKSGTTIRIPVTVGASEHGIDSLRPRSIPDSIAISGCAPWINGSIVGIAKFLMNHMTDGIVRSHPISESRVVEFCEKNKDALIFTNNLFTAKKKGLSVIPIRGVIVCAYYCEDKDKLKTFIEKLHSGIIEGPQDSAVIRLRELIINKGATTGGASARQSIAKRTCRALKGYIKSEPLMALYEPKDMLYLLPKDKW